MIPLISAGFVLWSLYLDRRHQNAPKKSPAMGAEIAFLMAGDVLCSEKAKYHPAKQTRQAFHETEQRGFSPNAGIRD